MITFSISYSLKEELGNVASDIKAELKKSIDSAREELQAITPVDTGEAASSWVAGPIASLSTSFYANLHNDEDYVKYLNAGSSLQAPAFFIEAVVLKYGLPTGTIVEYNK